jgi:hypothetical protein
MALALAVAVFVVLGDGRAGTELAVYSTGRLAFLFFLPSYIGGSLVTLLGAAMQPVRRQARELGLAFSAVLAVHLALIGWLCWIGNVPPIETFLVFGFGVVWVLLLALCSVDRIGRAVTLPVWWVLRNIGTNYIALIFALDFLAPKHAHSPLSAASNAAFAFLSVLGPSVRLFAWLKRLAAGSVRRVTSTKGA